VAKVTAGSPSGTGGFAPDLRRRDQRDSGNGEELVGVGLAVAWVPVGVEVGLDGAVWDGVAAGVVYVGEADGVVVALLREVVAGADEDGVSVAGRLGVTDRVGVAVPGVRLVGVLLAAGVFPGTASPGG